MTLKQDLTGAVEKCNTYIQRGNSCLFTHFKILWIKHILQYDNLFIPLSSTSWFLWSPIKESETAFISFNYQRLLWTHCYSQNNTIK